MSEVQKRPALRPGRKSRDEKRQEHMEIVAAKFASPPASISDRLRHVLTSLECTEAWLENGCDPKQAAAEIRLNIANLKKIKVTE